MGPLGYMAFMIFATALGSGAELAVDGTTGTGASGAVYGIAGLLWAGRAYSEDWRRVMTRQTLNLFVGWGLFCVVATWLHVMMIANAAHAAGFLFGLSIGWLFFSPRRRWVWIAPLVGLVLVTVVSVTWMPWSGDWLAWRGYHQFLAGRYRAAIASFERSIERGENSAYALDNIERAWTNVAYRAMQRHDSAGMLQAQGEALAAAERLRAAGGKPFDSSNEDSDSGAQPAPPNSPKASRPQALSRRRQAPPQSNRTPLPSLPPPDRDPDKRQTRRRL
jgi:hypothetical protein